MRSRRSGPAASLLAVLALAAGGVGGTPGVILAQGAGSAGGELLRLSAGTRAAAFGGAYAAATDDTDGLFYNPASIAWFERGAGLGYQAYVEGVTLGTASGALVLGPVHIGAGIVFLDAGTIEEVRPDPAFGGERGMATGETVGATETAARVAAALPLMEGRASAGVALGFTTSDLAGVGRSAPFVDVGAQLRLGQLTLAAAGRSLGGSLSSDSFGDAPLPRELRFGAAYRYATPSGAGVAAGSDLSYGLTDGTLGIALGGEAGLLPDDGSVVAVLRAGFTLGESEEHLGRFRVGGGVGMRGLALDYTIQMFEYLGSIHRVGVRWTP